jgi:hypothetical protein
VGSIKRAEDIELVVSGLVINAVKATARQQRPSRLYVKMITGSSC